MDMEMEIDMDIDIVQNETASEEPQIGVYVP